MNTTTTCPHSALSPVDHSLMACIRKMHHIGSCWSGGWEWAVQPHAGTTTRPILASVVGDQVQITAAGPEQGRVGIIKYFTRQRTAKIRFDKNPEVSCGYMRSEYQITDRTTPLPENQYRR